MTAVDLKPIQTRYSGYNFRSRQEARYAVFFTARGWPWDYEPEGYNLPSGWYLPDFRVRVPQQCGCCNYEPNWEWFEIKGQGLTARAVTLATELAEASVMQVTILGRIPQPGGRERAWQARGPRPSAWNPTTSRYDVTGPSRGVHDMYRHFISVPYVDGMGDALSARFEHGESGPT